MKTDPLFGIHAKALTLRAQRAGILASNIANADTPHYKARDLDFRAALAAVEGRAVTLRRTDARHLPAPDLLPTAVALRYRVPVQPSPDGNTVDPHVERAAFADNALRYRASLQFLGGRIRTLLTAIRGQ
ncbi:flagellar basal-body rod protein FlgB [Inmirania thermothiophila]|uniref:Flagellar basal body rod protein FlgB n=2 Tax=Inmirania thermothiophila TaxID=1750597 RepID=A0A3N1Y7U1_9GAMM|nr:flagellar basal body rod protein FlgB [Inmirania thermothiophila]ROR34906.1 flagellar basal-body rod protein FlgB [Inmirania thermothiophila]